MPKAFISYSWTSKQHQQWVLDLATALRANGVDAILDRWDLKEGHDAIAFMERMVTDPTVEKVVIVLDRSYAEKADDRQGGVGTETQIITPQIYAKSDQNKFVGVVSEVGADGKPFKPAYYASRIYIDLSNEDIYAENFEQLLRWIFDKPVYPKPPVGRPPEFLKEDVMLLPTRPHAQRAVSLLRSSSPGALGAVVEYLDSLSENFEMLRIKDPGGTCELDEQVVNSIDAFLPYRDEFVAVITVVARWSLSSEYVTAIKGFFERLIPFMYRPDTLVSWSDEWFDNYKFIINELFLYTIAILIRNGKFLEVDALLSERFFVGAATQVSAAVDESLQHYTIFQHYLGSLQRRNARLQLRKVSVHAELLKNRLAVRGISLSDLMQADTVLYIRSIAQMKANNVKPFWWPESLIWSVRCRNAFEIFARAESTNYFNRLSKMLGVSGRDELALIVKDLTDGKLSQSYLPCWQFDRLPLERLTGITKLATLP